MTHASPWKKRKASSATAGSDTSVDGPCHGRRVRPWRRETALLRWTDAKEASAVPVEVSKGISKRSSGKSTTHVCVCGWCGEWKDLVHHLVHVHACPSYIAKSLIRKP